jgi:hypothetical protein
MSWQEAVGLEIVLKGVVVCVGGSNGSMTLILEVRSYI